MRLQSIIEIVIAEPVVLVRTNLHIDAMVSIDEAVAHLKPRVSFEVRGVNNCFGYSSNEAEFGTSKARATRCCLSEREAREDRT